jgi:replicative DNA helicase
MSARYTPHSLEAEKAVLGGVMIDSERIFDVVDALRPTDFYRTAHGQIFAVFLELAEKHEPIDFLTVRERLLGKGQLDDVGGPAYIASMTDGMPRSSNVESYARIVREKADLRRLLAAANRIIEDTYEHENEPRLAIDRAEQAIFDVSQQNVRGDFIDAQQLVTECFAAVQQLTERKDGVTGVPTGFADFDDMTRGFQPGALALIAARPSMGKTAFALNIAYQAAIAGQHVGFFSLEMSRQELFMRLVASVGRVDSHRLQSGYLNQSDFGRISDAMTAIADSHLHIDDSPVVGMLDVRGKARRLKKKAGLSLIIVDYLQLMQMPKAENRNLAVADISRGLKLLARELEIPVVALSQLSRDTERRSEKKPMLSDLRDSGALEQDADLVVFIHRPEVYGETPDNQGLAEIIIAKHRNGRTGTINLRWSKESTRFDSRSSAA